MVVLSLLLIVIIGGLGSAFAQTKVQKREQKLSVTNSLLVYPSEVLSSNWSGTEHVLSPDLGEDALYQKFNQNNSAYVPHSPVQFEENESSISIPVDSSDVPDVVDEVEVLVPEDVEATDSSAATEDQATENIPVQTPEASESEVEDSQSENETIEPESQSEAEAEPEPVVLKKATESLFTFLGTVTELFPFMNTVEETLTEVVAEPEEVEQQELVVENESVEEATDSQTEEIPVPLSQNDVTSSSTQSVVEDEQSSSEVEVEGENELPETTESPSANNNSHALVLSDFSTPDLKPGEFIKNAQLRMSLGASYIKDENNPGNVPVLEVFYTTPSSTQQVGTVIIDQEISNALNGGYFLFALPQIVGTDELANAEVEVRFAGDTKNLEGVYLDAAWLQIEVEQIDKKLLEERGLKDALLHLKEPDLHTLLSEAVDFNREQLPRFSLRYNSQRNVAVQFVRDLFGKSLADVEDVRFIHKSGEVHVFPQTHVTAEGLLTLNLQEKDKERLVPGEYTVEIVVNEGGVTYTDSFSFQWGMLSINPHQSSYALGDTAVISMGALTPSGNTVCDADLRLFMIDQNDVVFQVPVMQSGACVGNNVTDIPDYHASFTPSQAGPYMMYLERLNEDGTVLSHTTDTVLFETSLPLSIERKGPTRIYPLASYPMELTVRAQGAWSGTLTEQVPATFSVMETDATITHVGDMQELTWNLDIAAGGSQTVSYAFDAPDLSPFLYMIGAARLEGSFTGDIVEEAPAEIISEEDIVTDVPASTTPQSEEEEAIETIEEGTPTAEEVEFVPSEGTQAEDEISDEVIVTSETIEEEPSFIDAVIDFFTPDAVDVEEPVEIESPETNQESLPSPTPMEQVVATDIAQGSGSFEEHRQWQVASDATGNMVVFWDGTNIPTGWSCLSCGSGTFYQRFAMGSSTYNTTGGATTHTHTAVGSVLASSLSTTETGSGTAAPVNHSHTYTPTINSVSNLPSYRQLRVIQYTSATGEPPTLPTGVIGVFDTTVPTGWTRYSAQDGYYIRGEDTAGTTGGSNTETHTITGTTGASSGAGTRTRGGGAASAAIDTHTHTVSGNTASTNKEPQYIEVILGKLNATSTAPNGLITMWTEDVPAGWLNQSAGPSDPFYNRFLKGAASYGATGGALTHTPANVNGLTSSGPSALSGTNHPAGSAGASGVHTHSVNVQTFSAGNHTPPFITAVFGKRQGTSPVYEQLSYRWYTNTNAQTPTDAWPSGGINVLEAEAIDAATTPVKSGEVIRLRMNVEVSNATSTATAFNLQYGTAASCDLVSSWHPVGNTSSSTADWRGYNNTSVTDHSTLSSTTLASTSVAETYEENGVATTTPNDISVGDVGEWDYVLQHNGANAGSVYCFRMVEEDGTPFSAYTTYPELLTNYAPISPTLSLLFDNEKVATTTPKFQFVTTDAEGEDLQYEIEIDNDYDFSSPTIDNNSISQSTRFDNLVVPADKAPFNQGQLMQYSVQPANALTNNTTYWWRTRAQDPSGSNSWGEWSALRSFTVDTSLPASAWFQTTEEQFETNTLEGVEATGSDLVSLISGSTTGNMTGNPIDFDDGTSGTAWGELQFTDVETSSDLKYQLEYYDGASWNLIPDIDLAGNSTGFDTSPVSLLGLDTDTYNEIRIISNFTNSGASPTLSDWTLEWGYRVETPTITKLFPNERTGTTTPTLEFTTSDPQGDSLTYQVSWSTDNTFTSSTTVTSDADLLFENIETGIDSDPFISGETIQYTIQPGDALTNNTTYWWRVRAKDTTGDDEYSFWTDARSFTVTTGTNVSTWYQTTQEQFNENILSGTIALSSDSVSVATTASEAMIVYGEGVDTEPRYRTWTGSAWANEALMLDIGAPLRWATVKAATTREEYVAATVGTDNDLNLQVYALGVWGDLFEPVSTMGDLGAKGFDVAYETTSGDAIVAYCDGDADPSYYVWDGSSWTSGGTINLASANACEWIQLAADPTSNEIVLLSRDSTGSQYEAQVWNGSSWGNSTTLGSIVDADHAGMAVSYEESGGQAVIVVSDGNPARFRWNSWNGTTWGTAATEALGDDFEWGSLVADQGSDEMLLCFSDEDTNIGVVRWTGSAWTGFTEHLTTTGKAKTDPGFACTFENTTGRDNYEMMTYTDTTQTNYRTWNNTTWAGATQVNSIGDAITMGLDRTGVGLILGTFFDETNDSLLFSSWNGSSWSTTATLEADVSVDTSQYGYPYDIAVRNSGSEGTAIVSPQIDFNEGSGPYWDSFSWTDSTPGSSDALYFVQYYNTASSAWQFIPNADLTGNGSGFTTSPVDLSGLDVSTYELIRPYAEMSCAGANCPTLSDWTVTWAEGITISGTADQYDQTTNVTSGTVAVAVNGVLQTGKTGTIAAGAWSIANVTVFPGDVVTVFVSSANDANEAVAVTVYDGSGDMDGIELFERHLSIGSNDIATVTNAQLGLYDLTNTEDIFYDVDGGNDLLVCATTGCSDSELFIKAGNTFQSGSGGNVTTHDIENNGTLSLNGNTLRLSGSWDNNATTSMATSTIIFTATSTVETVDDTGAVSPSFYNVTFGETSGSATWTLQTPLDVNNALSLSYGTLARGSRALTIAGNLSIGANGSVSGIGTTTFDGATAAIWSDASAGVVNMGQVVVNGTNKTVTLGGNVDAQSLTIGADDTFDLSTSNYDITVYGNWINNNTFNARSGDVFFAATTTGRIITVGGDTFYNASFTGSGGAWSFTESTLGVTNDFAISNGVVTLPTATTTISGSFTNNAGTFVHNNSAILFNSSAAETLTLSGTALTNAFYNVRFQGSGSWTFTEANATTTNRFAIAQGTVTFPSNTLSIGDSFLNTAGTFAHNSGTVRFTSSGSETIDTNASFNSLRFTGSGSWSFVDASVTALGSVTISSGSVTFPSNTFTIGGSLTNSATLSHNSGTVLFNSADVGETINLGSSSLYNMTFNSGTGGWTIGSNATTTNNTILTAANSLTLASGQRLSVGGTFTNSVGGAATTWTGSTLSLEAGSYAINAKTTGGDGYGTLVVKANTDIKMWNSSSTVYTVDGTGSLYSQDHSAVDGDLYIFGNYPRTTGTEYWSYATDFDGTALGGGSRQVDVRFASGASASLSGSTLNVTGISSATTTVANQGSGTYTLSVSAGTTTAAYYSFADLGATGVTLTGGTAVPSLGYGSYISATNAGTALTLSSTTIDANPGLQIYNVSFATSTAINADNVTQTDGTPSSYWWFRSSYGNLDGEANDNDTGDPGSVRWDDSSLVFSVSGVVYEDDGVTPLTGGTCNGVATPVRVMVSGVTSYDGTCSAVDGSFTIPGIVAIGDPVITVFLNGASGGEKAVTITKTPTQDITGLDLIDNRVITRHEDVSPLSIADMSVYDNTNDTDISFTAATGSPSTLSVFADHELRVSATSTFTPGGVVTVNSGGTGNPYDGSLYIENGATFTGAGTTTYSVGGTFTLSDSATFIPASTTVAMTATTTGKAIAVDSNTTATFHALQFTGVGGGWNINGDISASDDIDITQGTVTGTGDILLTYGSISGNGLLSLGGGTTTINRSNTLGGTQGWTFHNLSLGSGLVVGTTTLGSSATTTIGGVLTINTAHYLDAGGSAFELSGSGTVFVENGTFLEDTSTVRYSGTGATNIRSTAYYNLDLNAGAGTPTYTATGLGIQVFNDLTVGGESTTVVNFNTNDTALDVNGDVTIASNGTLQASNTGTFTVGGSWDNNGTFTNNSGTVTFDTGSSASIAAGGSWFGNIVLNGTGAFTIPEHATSSANFTLTAASAFTLNSGQVLAVGGVFTNGVGGGATDWTGSTLRLYSGTNYQINAKTISDSYNVLLIASNTDIRMWGSQATAYTVDATGSLYSQDHAGVDGDLYIYGNYPGFAGTDYWSYATDFDGTALGAGSRQAEVFFQNGASMTKTSGGLHVLGTASASTTIQNQGSGTYGLLIGGNASTSWSYYDIENTTIAGLTLTGTPNVVTLSYGDIEVSQGSGSAITLGGTVLTANPAKTFTNNGFSTTTGLLGYNVTATGTSVSSWRFTNHYGNLDGEVHDVDPDGNPGYIAWDDSAATITISGNVYSDEGVTVSGVCDGATNNVHVRVAGLTSYTTNCNGTTGLYSVSGVNYTVGDSIIAYIDGEAEKGATVTEDPISNIGNLHIYENRVIARHEGADSLSIDDMAVWDSSDDADIPFTAVSGTPDTLTLPANRKLIVWTSKEFEPGGNVTLSGGGGGAAYDGTLEAYSNAIVTFAGTQQHAIGGSMVFGAGATFDAGLSTTTFTTASAARTIDINEEGFYNVAFTGAGSWTISDATLSARSVYITSGAVTLGSGTTTIAGSWSNNGGSFTVSGSPFVFTANSSGHVIRGGGSNFADLNFNGVGGSWSMTDTNATSTGSVVINAGTVSLPSGIFAIGGDFRNERGAVTHNTSELVLTNATNATLLASSSDLYAVAFNGAGDFVMEDQSLTFLDDIRILQGNVTFASGTLSVGGSLVATGGTFDNATGTILFNSSDTGETVNPGTNDFYNVIFSGAGGGWTMAASATTTNNFSLTLGSSYTQQTGTVLAVGNVFSNAIGGTATVWTGSTLKLDSGTNYSINTKSAGGDQYQTLLIGANTDIRSWNSRATTTTVAATGSFYSQDHGAVNGALNIYGDFHISTTTEYWSYATDFDGTSLTGVERAVTVSIAANASTTVDGGTLHMIGTSGNRTTIQNQGSGTYAFAVSDGTFNSLYYTFRNLNANGLLFSGTPTITSLSQGDFELAVSGGDLLSLSSTTLDANASKVISGVRFATTSAITGTNVNLTGSTSNAWSFVSHTGNLSGEDYDNDGVTLCGSIRWNDSSCLLTQQTHYRWRHDDGGLDVPSGEWYDADWDARKRVRLQNGDATTYTDAVVKLSVSYDADMQVDFDDLRFTDESGTTTIPFFIDRYAASTDADVWVQVPSLAAEDITTIFMYFDNPSATSSSSAEDTFIAADDFEDTNITEYSGDTTLFVVDGTFAYGGSYGLDATSHEEDRAASGIARFDMNVSQGEIIRYMQYIDTVDGSADEPCVLFGVQSPVTAHDNYAVCLEQVSGTDRISIVQDAESTDTYGSVTMLSSSTVAYEDGWYEVEIDWQTNDDIDVTLLKDGSVVTTVSTNDGTYTSGGFGFTYWYQYGGWDNFSSRVRVDTEPTVYFGAKQTDGGASWAGILDNSAAYVPGDIARLRLALENTGLQISGQTFDLEWAVKGAAPSCEAVPSGNYVAVPPQSSCGTSDLCMETTTHYGDGDVTTDLLFETEGAFTAGRAIEDPSNTTASSTIEQNEYTELEYAVTPTINATEPAYCLRVTDAGDPVDTYLSVAELELRFDPVVTNVSLNGGAAISLVPGTTTTVYATGTVTDLNGPLDLLNATSTIYRSGAGAMCTPDNNNCYISTAPLCEFSNCLGNSCTVSCSADIFFHADATDDDPYEGEEWLALIEVSDLSGGFDIEAVPDGVELFSLPALDVTTSINYGSLAVSSTTGAYNPTTTVQNLGNIPIDLRLQGTDLTDTGSSFIPTSEQLFATTTFTYTGCTNCSAMSSTTPVDLEVDLSKPTSVGSPITDIVYWGIEIPFGVASNPHSGTNIFYAISETP